jgi:hypothetical protein
MSTSTSSGKLEQRKLAQLQFLLLLAFPSKEAAINPPLPFSHALNQSSSLPEKKTKIITFESRR